MRSEAPATTAAPPAPPPAAPARQDRRLPGLVHVRLVERDSGQPYRYRLIVRSGDAVSFGPAVTRPSAFSGLSGTTRFVGVPRHVYFGGQNGA